ncbi:hypothetical protein BST36_29960, partial [Mycolicibacterium moriokaense]
DFVDAHRAEFGVEPIITVLRTAGVSMAPSTYYDTKTRAPTARGSWCRSRCSGPSTPLRCAGR